ncbi:MAG: hemerythrin family protein [Magnetococcus sp. WYHC-3]
MGGLWRNEYALDHDMIDTQHRELLERLERMFVVNFGKEPERALEMLGFLESYVVAHFQAEERLMSDCGYPDLASHAQLHAQFRARVETFKQEHLPGNLTEAGFNDLLTVISTWVSNHILTADQKIGAYLRTHALSPG